MDRLKAIFELRAMLRQMERELGLDRLNQNERDIVLAARDLSGGPGDVIESDALRNHELVRRQAQATFYRTLRTLLDQGLLDRASGSRAKSYVLSDKAFEE